MLATCMNALCLQSALEGQGVPTRVQTAIEMRVCRSLSPSWHLKVMYYFGKRFACTLVVIPNVAVPGASAILHMQAHLQSTAR